MYSSACHDKSKKIIIQSRKLVLALMKKRQTQEEPSEKTAKHQNKLQTEGLPRHPAELIQRIQSTKHLNLEYQSQAL